MRDIYAATRCERGTGGTGARGHGLAMGLGVYQIQIPVQAFVSSHVFMNMFGTINYCMWGEDACGRIHSGSEFNLSDSQVGVVNIESGALVRRQDSGVIFDTWR